MNRSTKLTKVAKSYTEPATAKANVPPVGQRGRPKGSKNKKGLQEKITKTFTAAMADAQALVVAEPDFDGGGTKEHAPVVSKESLERRVARRLNVLDRYLTDERLLALLDQSGLKEVGIYEGIMMDKALILKGQPTVIIGNEDRSQIDAVLPRLLAELRRRKMITSVSERKIEFTSPGGDSGDFA